MTPEQLRASILQQAMEGKLVKQDPNDEPASVLLEKIAEEKARLIREKKIKRTKKLPEVTDDEKPFEIPDSWEWVRLGNLVRFTLGKTPKRSMPEYWESGTIPWVSISDLNNATLKQTKEHITPKAYSEVFGETISTAGTMLMSFKLTIGKVSILGIDAVHNEAIISIYPYIDANKIIRDYLYKVLPFISQHGDFNTAIKGKTLNKKSLSNLLIPLPPLAEQKRIVARLDQLMPLVDEYAEAYDKLKKLDDGFNDKLKQSLLQYAMEGKLVKQDPNDEPASVLLEKIAEEKARLIREKKIKRTKKLPEVTDDEKPFEIPDSWEWVRLGNLVRFTLGKTPKRSMPEYWESGTIPWVSISDLNNATLKQTKEHITPKAYSEVFGETISTAGTMLMSFKLTIGKVSILGIDAVHNEAIISIYPYIDANKIIRDYLYKVLPFISQHGDFNTAIKGKTLNKKSLSNLLIPLPPLAEQKRIVAKLDQLMSIMH